MEFQVQLFLRELHNGFHLVQVIGEPTLCLYTDDLDQAREELTLVLSDRLERSNPGRLGNSAVPRDYAVEPVELPEGLIVEAAIGPEGKPTKVSTLLSRDKRWHRMWFPRWKARYWVPVGEDTTEAATAFLSNYLEKMSDHERLALRYEGREWIESLTIEVDPAPLSAFTGKNKGKSMLPVPQPKEDDEEDEDKGKDKKGKKGGRKKKRPPTPTLSKIGLNLSKLAKDGELERAWEQDAAVSDLMQMLTVRKGASVVIIGASGVGKSTVLSELVHKIIDPKQPEKLRTRPVWFVDASRLIAGDGYFGDWQRQTLDAIQECIDAEVIWYIGSLLPLLDAGKHIGSDQNVSMLMKPFLMGQRLTVVGECTPKTWAQLELRDAGFARMFTPYHLEEPPPEGTRQILSKVASELKDEAGIEVTASGLRAVEALCRRFGGEQSHLGRSIHFLRRLVDNAWTQDEEVVGRPEVVSQFCAETGLPEFIVRDDLPLDPESVWLAFRKRLIGQEEAVRRMTDLVAMIKAGLSDLRRPLGSFLFVGPTGVGKTEMAKALAEFLFGRADRMIRFDMSEFISPASVHRFLGGPEEEGKLVSEIRRSPFSVVLLDEIEKAHPAVFDVLLQVLGEARLTDGAGRTADFRNAVIIMTSNLGVGAMREAPGFEGGAKTSYKSHFLSAAEKFFRPEFVGRIDHIVAFEPLEKAAIEKITARELGGFLDREGIRQRDITVGVADEVSPWLADKGVDPRYGARPLKRLIERSLTAPLARHLSSINAGSTQHIVIQIEGDRPGFAHQEGKGQAESGTSRERLGRMLRRIGLIRYQTDQWRNTPTYRELVQGIRLLERLSQDRNFWKDRERAEARMRHCERDIALRDAFEALRGRITSIEDLAYELYYDRNDEPLGAIDDELGEAIAALDGLEWRLFSRRFLAPDAAVLYITSSKGSSRFFTECVDTYVELANIHGWTITSNVARPVDPNAAPPEIHEEGKKPKRSRQKGTPFNWQRVERYAPDPDLTERAAAAARQKFLWRTCDNDHQNYPRALVFKGPMAAAWLCGESGVHARIGSAPEQEQIKVRFTERHAGLESVEQVRTYKNTDKKRLFHTGKRLVYDIHLGAQTPFEPRMHRIIARYMRGWIYEVIFGTGAHVLFDRGGE